MCIRDSITPKVTVLIAAFNEEREIKQTVLNKLSQDYPTDLLEILVVSDGSTDRTDEIVRELTRSHQGRVSLLRQEPRQGKTQALNMAVAHVSGEILIFSDAKMCIRDRFDIDYVSLKLEEHLMGRHKNNKLLFSLIMFQEWYERHAV